MASTTNPPQIENYVIQQTLGRGAHGVVYRAHRRGEPHVPVALKVVENRGSRDRLLLEPALLSRLDHPCIVRLRDYFLKGDDLVLVLEYVEGQDLQSFLRAPEALFDPAEVHELLLQLASALAHAHGRGVVHRDIKPSNILVVRDGPRTRYVLTDFGIGRVDEGIQVEKHTGGTYLFMAPEQLRGRPVPQSDLWALGVVAYRLLTGRLPFPGPTLPEVAGQIFYGTPQPPGPLAPKPLDPRLESAALRLLERSLQERYGSAVELLRDLGYHGAPEEVLDSGGARRAPTPPVRTVLDRQIDRRIAWRWLVVISAMVVYLVPGGVISGALLFIGLGLFFRGQAGPSSVRVTGTACGLAVLGAHVTLRYGFPDLDRVGLSLMSWLQQAADEGKEQVVSLLGPAAGPYVGYARVAAVVLILGFMLFLPVIAGAAFVSLRWLQRQRILRRAALAGRTDPDRLLAAFRAGLDSRTTDVDFHLKYAEALFDLGRVKEAAVEAQLLLGQDPFNFGGNLLLANAYYQLGLVSSCVKVCEDYLAVTGYCFEFSELRAQCRPRATSCTSIPARSGFCRSARGLADTACNSSGTAPACKSRRLPWWSPAGCGPCSCPYWASSSRRS
jgi:hypothetical protein